MGRSGHSGRPFCFISCSRMKGGTSTTRNGCATKQVEDLMALATSTFGITTHAPRNSAPTDSGTSLFVFAGRFVAQQFVIGLEFAGFPEHFPHVERLRFEVEDKF